MAQQEAKKGRGQAGWKVNDSYSGCRYLECRYLGNY
jgi:hypothetical protein